MAMAVDVSRLAMIGMRIRMGGRVVVVLYLEDLLALQDHEHRVQATSQLDAFTQCCGSDKKPGTCCTCNQHIAICARL